MKFDKIKIAAAVVALVSAAAAGNAIAGSTHHIPVYIDWTTSTAKGTTHAARASANSNEQIYCAVSANESGSAHAFCYALNAAGEFAQCHSVSPGIVAAVQSISDYSHIWFDWNEQGQCTWLRVSTGSRYLP